MPSIAPILSRLQTIFVKVETIMGTPVVGDTPVLVENLLIEPTSEFVKRNGVGLYAGNTFTGVVQGRTGKCSFSTELRTSGSQTWDPALAILFKACGFKTSAGQVINTYSALSDQTTISIDVYRGGVIQSLFGCSGKWKISGKAGQRIMVVFDFMGLYKPIADTAMIAFAPATRAPLKFGTGAFTLDGVANKISSFELDSGNEVTPRSDIGAGLVATLGAQGILHFMVSDYDTRLKIDPEIDNVATFPAESVWQAGTPKVVSFKVGDGVDKITFDMPAVQAMSLPMGERDGIRIYEWEGQCIHSSGNDALKMTVAAAP
jgi:hypothetical protein